MNRKVSDGTNEMMYAVSLDTFMLMGALGILLGIIFILVNPTLNVEPPPPVPPNGPVNTQAWDKLYKSLKPSTKDEFLNSENALSMQQRTLHIVSETAGSINLYAARKDGKNETHRIRVSVYNQEGVLWYSVAYWRNGKRIQNDQQVSMELNQWPQILGITLQ